jgi:hypothetical protein
MLRVSAAVHSPLATSMADRILARHCVAQQRSARLPVAGIAVHLLPVAPHDMVVHAGCWEPLPQLVRARIVTHFQLL